MSGGIKALLLDLDGTLVDTAPDMVGALNRLLADRGKPEISIAEGRNYVSHGANALIKLGFGITTEDPDHAALRSEFLEHYANGIHVQSDLFDGMEQVLSHCEQQSIRWGIITNKPQHLTDALLTSMALDQRAACAIGGDALPKTKPHPMPILHACMLLKLAPSECLYVGDAERDIEAGNKAGTQTATAEWGYIQPEEKPADWGATYRLSAPADILEHL